MALSKPIYVICKETELGLEPLWQGGRTTNHAVRSFDDRGAAEKSMYYLKGQVNITEPLRIIKITSYDVIDLAG